MTDYTWDGGGDGTSWTDDDNWGGSGHPNSNNDKATINVGSASISMDIAGGTGVVGEVYLGSGFTGTVTQAYNFTIDNAGSENGVLEINNSSATWNCNGSTLTVDSHIKGNGTFTVGTSTVTCTGQTTVGTFNISTGTYNYFDDFRPTTANITDNATINQTSSGGQLGGRIIITASKTPTFNAIGRFHSSFRIDSGEQGNSTINLDLSENQNGPARDLYFYNLELDSRGSGDPHTITLKGGLYCTGTLTITDGVIDTESGVSHAIQVTKHIDIADAGTLTGRGSSISTGTMTLRDGSTLTNSGTITITGNDKANSPAGSNYIWRNIETDGTAFAPTAGKVHFSGTDNNGGYIFESKFYNVDVTLASTGQDVAMSGIFNDLVTIGGDLTVIEGTLKRNSESHDITVTGDVEVQDGAVLGDNDETGANSFGSLTIASGGTYKATSGTTTVTGTYTQNGTFTHNDGLLHISNGGQTMTGTSPMGPFYDLKSSGDNNEIRKNMAVENSFIIATGYVRPTVANADWKIGTTSAAGYISGSVSTPVRVFDNEIGSATFTVSGASTVYPAQLKGNEWAWTQTGQSQTAAIAFGNVDVQFDVDTSTGADNTVKITLTGDCEFDAVTVSSGDTLDLNGQRMECSDVLNIDGAIDTDSSLMVLGDYIDYDGEGWTGNASTNLMFTGAGASNDFAGQSYKTIMFNGTGENSLNWTTDFSDTNFIVASDFKPDHNMTCTNLTIPTGATFDADVDTHTIKGDLKMSGGLIGKSAAVFNGSSQEADFGDPSELDLTSTMTIEAWIKPESTSSLQGIVGKVLFGSAGSQEWGLSSNGSRWFFKCGNTSSNGTAQSNSTFSTGKWYHVAATKDSSGVMRLYVNGKQDQQTVPTVTGDCNPGYNFIMGRRASNVDFFFEGTLGLVRIFNTERTQAQIRTDMFNDFSNMDSTTGLVACYQFDTGTGTTIYDSTSNNLDSSSSDATWAGAGSFTGGTSTLFLNKNGTQYITYLDTDYVAGLKIGADSTTIMQDIVGNNHAIYVSGNLTVSGTLEDTSQEYLRIPNNFITLGSALDVSNGDVSEMQIVFDNNAGTNINLPASTWKEIDINYGTITLTGDVTVNNSWRVRQHGSAIAKANGNTMTVSGACQLYSGATLDLTNSSTLLFNTAGGEFLSDADSTLLAGGGGVTIKGYTSATKTDFDSQNDFKVVGTVENINVTNEELSVTGKVINCSGEIIQQHQSVDAAQQLDFDSAEDRDIMLGRDLDKNTELVG